MLAGRESERRRLADLLDGARQGTSGVLLIRGEAGVGKSALLEEVVAGAADMTVLRSRGVEAEAELPYAALHRLLRPALPFLGSLPAPQADALRRALGMESGRGDDRFLVSLAVLGLMDTLAGDRPVLCVVDDAHWLDGASAHTLTFVARRLLAESVAMVLAVRDPAAREFVADDLPELRVGVLDGEAAGQVLAAHGGVAVHSDVRARLVEATGGNPLALVELARALDPAELTGARPLPVPLPVTGALEQAFLERVRRLPETSRLMLQVASADDTGRLATILAASAALGLDVSALGPAERAGVVRVRGDGLEFRHPLVRSAVYQGATFADRQAAHRALASVLDPDVDADRRAWHRAASVVEADPQVALELDGVAERARALGAYAAAAAALRRSAELTTDREERARRLYAAGDNLWHDGRRDQAGPLLRQARAMSADQTLHTKVDRLLGLIELGAGDAGSSYRILRSAAESAAGRDPVQALDLLVVAAEVASLALDAADSAALGPLAARLDVGDGVRERFLLRFLAGVASQYAGDADGAIGPLREAMELVGGTTEPRLLIAAHRAAFYLGDDAGGKRLAAAIVAHIRDTAQVGLLPLADLRLAIWEMFAGRWASGAAVATEAVQLARATGQDELARPALALLALLAALRGDRDGCVRHAEEALAPPHRPMRLVDEFVCWAYGLLDLAAGEPRPALERMRDLARPMMLICSGLDRFEAAYHAGDLGRAAAVADELAGHAERTGRPWALARAAHARALIGPAEEADRRFAEAIAYHEAADRPFERARTELARGAALRRARRRTEARVHLRAAFDRFEALGAAQWAERAQTELRACGQAVRRREAGGGIDRLTPQEVQVVRFVARGLSNADVAAQLFLSRRTVDFHLRNVFTKLGVTSRTELVHLVDAEPAPAG